MRHLASVSEHYWGLYKGSIQMQFPEMKLSHFPLRWFFQGQMDNMSPLIKVKVWYWTSGPMIIQFTEHTFVTQWLSETVLQDIGKINLYHIKLITKRRDL